MPKRAPNEGSVYQRADGRWVATAWVDGKRVYRYTQSRAQAHQALNQFINPNQKQLPTKVSSWLPTIAEWVEQWLATKAPDLRQSTLHTHRRTLVLTSKKTRTPEE